MQVSYPILNICPKILGLTNYKSFMDFSINHGREGVWFYVTKQIMIFAILFTIPLLMGVFVRIGKRKNDSMVLDE